MSVPIIIFHHGLFVLGDPPEILPAAIAIAYEQMEALKVSGLLDAAEEFHVGINGTPDDSEMFVQGIFPEKAKVVYHGLQCRNELRTMLLIEEWCRTHSGEAYIFYEHQKGSTHVPGTPYAEFVRVWRWRMMNTCVHGWRTCVKDLETYDTAGVHWLTGQGWDHSQHYHAGTIFWTRASFFRTIPSMTTRQRIKDSGLDAAESRFEAEVHIGNGSRLPVVRNYYDGPIGT